jgi:hypothetical protein
MQKISKTCEHCLETGLRNSAETEQGNAGFESMINSGYVFGGSMKRHTMLRA